MRDHNNATASCFAKKNIEKKGFYDQKRQTLQLASEIQ